MASERGRSGVYAIRCKPTRKMYVGQAVSIGDRWLTHRSHLRCGRHANRHLQSAWAKHGEDAFEFVVLADAPANASALAEAEQWWVDHLQPDFNIAPVAGSTLGVKHPPRSEEFKRRQSERQRGFRHSPETIEKLRAIAAAQDYHPTPEHIEKLRVANTGRHRSPETIEKWRAKVAGRKQPPEEIARRAAALKGHTTSEHTKRLIGDASRARLLGSKQNAELVEKRIAPLRGKPRPQHVIDAMSAGRQRWLAERKEGR